MEEEKIVIQLKNDKVAVLTICLQTELDIENLLRIDYSNIMGEILTWSLMYNRIANLRAEMSELVKETKLDTDIYEAQLKEEKRKLLQSKTEKRVTDTEVDTAVKLDARFAAKKKFQFKVEKEFDYFDALYWSAQSKDKKLDKLSDKLRPEDFERDLLEGTINGIMIKMSQNVIKG